MTADVYLDAGMKGWIANTAREECWRLPSWYGLDALVQDGYLCYCKCRNRYSVLTCLNHPGDEQRRWFMALVQKAFINHIMTLASKYSGNPEMPVSQLALDETTNVWDAIAPAQEEEATLLATLKAAPKELAELLVKLSKDGQEGSAMLRSRLRREGSRVRRGRRALRETTNEYLDRCYGQVGVTKLVTEFISG